MSNQKGSGSGGLMLGLLGAVGLAGVFLLGKKKSFPCPYGDGVFDSQAALDAHMAEAHPPVMYTVTFDPGSYGALLTGSLVQSVISGGNAEAPVLKVLDNWLPFITWNGWEHACTNITGDQTIHAEYTYIQYTVTFNLGAHGILTGGSLIQTVDYDSPPVPPNFTTASGWSFTGWDTNFSTVTGDMTITALYQADVIPQYTVTFDYGAGIGTPASFTGTVGTTIPAPYVYPRTGYNLIGWVPPTVITAANITYSAVWTPKKITITFNAAGGTTPIPTSKVVTYGLLYGTLPTVTKIGFTFRGWFTAISGGSNVHSLTLVNIQNAQILYAQWDVVFYQITFDSNGGSAVEAINTNYGTTVTPPADPTKTGYKFDGWSPAVPATMPAANIICIAQWAEIIPSFTITDTELNPIQIIEQGREIIINWQDFPADGEISILFSDSTDMGTYPTGPDGSGTTNLILYSEVGDWTIDVYSYPDFSIHLYQWITVTASISTVNFDSGIGIPIPSRIMRPGNLITAPVLYQPGYIFDGWYPDRATLGITNCVAQWVVADLYCDCNKDGFVDQLDFGIVLASYGKKLGQAGYDARADFDGNGIINIADFGLLAANYGQSAPVGVP